MYTQIITSAKTEKKFLSGPLFKAHGLEGDADLNGNSKIYTQHQSILPEQSLHCQLKRRVRESLHNARYVRFFMEYINTSFLDIARTITA